MTDKEKEARREREFQKQIKAHGGDGRPPNLKTTEEKVAACERGVCLKCGGQWDALHTHVWKHYEKELREQGVEDKRRMMAEGIRAYQTEHEIPPGVPLASDDHRKRLSEGQSKGMQGPDGERRKAQIAETLSRPRPDLRGKTGPNPSGVAFDNWPMVKLLSQGYTAEVTAKNLGLKGKNRAHTVNKRAQGLGLRGFGTEFLLDHGKPFSNGRLFDLRGVSGFECLDFDRCAGLSEGRSRGTRPRDSLALPDDARLAVEWRDGVLRELMDAANSGERILRLGDKHFPVDQVLKTFLPELAELNNALVLTMPRIRQAARKNPEWTAAQLCEEICSFAQIEQSVEADDTRWRVTLRYLWQAEDWIIGPADSPGTNFERLRASEVQNDGQFAREMMGSRYGASQWTVQNALKPSTGRIEPSNIQALILRFAPKFARAKPKLGRDKGQHPDTIERIRRAAGLEMAHPRWTQERMAPFVFWDTPKSCQANIRPFLSTYRKDIELKKQTLTR